MAKIDKTKLNKEWEDQIKIRLENYQIMNIKEIQEILLYLLNK